MDEVTLLENKKDLKLYRFAIILVFITALIIASVVGVSTMNYNNVAGASNTFLGLLMDDQITDNTEDSDTYGMTFYREKNEDYNADEDQPIDAFKYYYLDSDNNKQYLTEGVYYPPEYYFVDEDVDVSPVFVYLGFYTTAFQKIQVLKNVAKVIIAVVALAVAAGFIYLWYRSWCRRQAIQKQYQRELDLLKK
jgi:uncharacterized protein YxeA